MKNIKLTFQSLLLVMSIAFSLLMPNLAFGLITPQPGDLQSPDGYNVQEVQQPQYPTDQFYIKVGPSIVLKCFPMDTQPNAYLCTFIEGNSK